MIFSPSSTQAFFSCPFLWLLSKRGWTPKTYSKKDVYAVRGSAVSEGLNTFNRNIGDPFEAAREVVDFEWERAKLDKRQWQDMKIPPLSKADVHENVQRLVTAYVKNPPRMFEVVESEYIFAKHGNARADVIARLSNGSLIAVDYKVKQNPANPYYRRTTVNDFRNSWQLMHYCYAIQQEFNIECLDYGILILWYDKKIEIQYCPFSITELRMQHWISSAHSAWALMEGILEGSIEPWEVASHSNKFGACEFQSACLEHDRDPDEMRKDYFLKQR